ncbi:sulfite exporter TauE/SafE family protein [Paracoccus luteus]|uniref:sulfite exporter TauE/SafE family protein n=1 Tax=Paracoccus luteus TaxID=2508543 RepID=UPI00106FFEEA|nr:sulfite exporter TauE/SafE family protein [Paracoccus luteus]
MSGLEPHLIWLAIAVTFFAGFVKGAVGFAMPMVMMSAFGSFLPADVALALLIMPTLVTNLVQSARHGLGPAIQTTRRYRWHIGMVVVFTFVSAPFARVLPQPAMYLALGLPITAFALWQLSGRPLSLPIHHQRRAEIVSGIVGGLYGGISGIWGPPLIVYLLSTGAAKAEQIRVQGAVFLTGAVMLSVAHLLTGVLNPQTLPLSLLMTLPGVLGMLFGFALHDRMDVAQFRRWTLVLLVLTGANLVRRALTM